MNINREIIMTIVKNSSNRLEGEQEILEINEQQLHLINKELNKLFSLHVVGKCGCCGENQADVCNKCLSEIAQDTASEAMGSR